MIPSTNEAVIRRTALAHWQRGDTLRAWLDGGSGYPFVVELPEREGAPGYAMATGALAGRPPPLEAGSKCHAGFGYRIEYDTAAGGRRPRRVVFDEPIDLIRYLGKEAELRRFLELAHQIRRRSPRLKEWIERHPMQVLAIGEGWPEVLDRLEREPGDPEALLERLTQPS